MLPIIALTVQVTNPEWSEEHGRIDLKMSDGTYIRRNLDGPEYYINVQLNVEVLTVHFNKNTMRVRYKWRGVVEIRDVDATPFFEVFKLTPAMDER